MEDNYRFLRRLLHRNQHRSISMSTRVSLLDVRVVGRLSRANTARSSASSSDMIGDAGESQLKAPVLSLSVESGAVSRSTRVYLLDPVLESGAVRSTYSCSVSFLLLPCFPDLSTVVSWCIRATLTSLGYLASKRAAFA